MSWSDASRMPLALSACALLLWIGCRSAPPPTGEAAVTVETILGDPFQHLGKTVTITAPVARPLSPHAFTVRSLGGLGEMLIFREDAGTSTVSVEPASIVRVQGTVKEYKSAELRKQAGDGLANDLAGYTGQTMLVASHIQLLPD